MDYIADVYDELLTQAEIQGFINKINSNYYFLFYLTQFNCYYYQSGHFRPFFIIETEKGSEKRK